MSPESQKAVDEIVRTVVNEDPSLRRWVEACRNVLSPKIDCVRNVFGECDRCDGRAALGVGEVPRG